MYTKRMETKVIRTRHEVTFHDGSTALAIIQDLKEVPPKALLIDWDMDEHSLTFEEEKETP